METNIFHDFDAELERKIRNERGLVSYVAQNTGGASEGEIGAVARLHAIGEVLDFDILGSISPWDENTAELLVYHLIESGYGNELEEWISDPDRLNLDPERVEEVEKVVRKVLGGVKTFQDR